MPGAEPLPGRYPLSFLRRRMVSFPMPRGKTGAGRPRDTVKWESPFAGQKADGSERRPEIRRDMKEYTIPGRRRISRSRGSGLSDGGLSPFSLCACLATVLVLLAGDAAGAFRSAGPNVRAEVSDGGGRPGFFDEETSHGPEEDPETPEGEADGEAGKREGSYLSHLWELDRESRNRTFGITPYRSNYLLPFTYNARPNEGPLRDTDPGYEVKNAEVKFQISFKIKLWEDVLGKHVDLWAGYTQLSFWQFYNFADSSPFRETDFEPELLLQFRTDFDLMGFRTRYINVGLNHQSNGRARPQSRSWNRVVGNVGLERGNLVLILGAWYRIPEKEKDDDNPDIEDYLGYGQVNVLYFRGEHRVGLYLRNNLRVRDNRGALQLDWSFPLIRWVSGYVQYVNGYGESLLDYNASANRIGVGFILKER